jgi:hypothetical protein
MQVLPKFSVREIIDADKNVLFQSFPLQYPSSTVMYSSNQNTIPAYFSAPVNSGYLETYPVSYAQPIRYTAAEVPHYVSQSSTPIAYSSGTPISMHYSDQLAQPTSVPIVMSPTPLVHFPPTNENANSGAYKVALIFGLHKFQTNLV